MEEQNMETQEKGGCSLKVRIKEGKGYMLRNEGREEKEIQSMGEKCNSLREVYLETRIGFKAFVAQTIDLHAVGEIFINNKVLPL